MIFNYIIVVMSYIPITKTTDKTLFSPYSTANVPNFYDIKARIFKFFLLEIKNFPKFGFFMYFCIMDNVNYTKLIVLRGKIIDTTIPRVMAIINSTPDSFYSGSRNTDKDKLKRTIDKAVSDGADILDVGGYSTRPGADYVSPQEEIDRTSAALDMIHSAYPHIPVSIDTFRATVAENAVVHHHADMINDISAMTIDKDMLKTVVRLQVPYVLMHIKGTPQTMQSLTQYTDFIPEILNFFAEKTLTLRHAGFAKEIIIDPGYGFAKTIEQNYTLLRELTVFETFRAPLLVGISRKTMIYKPLGITPDQALNGTSILNAFALERGANILRVHDVQEAVQAVKLFKMLHNIQ